MLIVLPFIEENRTKATNGRLQFGGNDHLILANHTCCECIKRNGIICIFHIFTTNDKHPSNDRVMVQRQRIAEETRLGWIDDEGDDKRCVSRRWLIRASKKCIFNKDVVKWVSRRRRRRTGEGVYYNLASLNCILIEVGTIHAHFDCIQFARSSEEKWLKLCAFKSRRPTVSANWTGQTTTTHWCEDWLNNRVFMYQYCESTGDSIARPFCISRSFLFSIASKRAFMFHCRVYRFLGLGRQSFTTNSTM